MSNYKTSKKCFFHIPWLQNQPTLNPNHTKHISITWNTQNDKDSGFIIILAQDLKENEPKVLIYGELTSYAPTTHLMEATLQPSKITRGRRDELIHTSVGA